MVRRKSKIVYFLAREFPVHERPCWKETVVAPDAASRIGGYRRPRRLESGGTDCALICEAGGSIGSLMKGLIKKALYRTLGRRGTRRLLGKVRGRQATFLETELIHDYFDGRHAGTMVDVGAHFGESFLDYLEDGWEVLAFEPDPENRRRLKETCKVHKLRLREEAVSDKELQEASFFASDESSGISSLSAFRPSHHEIRKVPVTTLRKALEEEKIQHVDFLKIDTEGHDLFVLKGFPWERQRPEVILCEFEDTKTARLGYGYRSMGDFLREQGYEVFLSEWFPIIRYGVKHRWRRWVRYPSDLEDSAAWGNFVAFRAGTNFSEIEPYLREHGVQSMDVQRA